MTLLPSNKLAIIGNPVAHSLSPQMHNAAFEKLKLNLHYERVRLSEKQLPAFFKEFKQGKYLGINVTVPYKEEVIPFLDELSSEAKCIGAVNTIKFVNGKLIGFNTDAPGYLKSLWCEKKFNPKNKTVLILGAGGASRAILFALASAKARHITVCNRNFLKAAKLCSYFQKQFKHTQFTPLEWNSNNLFKASTKLHLIVQTTSLGLKGEEIPHIPWKSIPKKCLISDIIYNETPFIKKANQLKFNTINGKGMLLYQGSIAFEIWTKKKAPILVMKRNLK